MTHQDKVILGDCTLYLGDCLDVMKDMPDKSVDAVITDPPYFLPQQSYVGTRENGYTKRNIGDMSVFNSYFKMFFSDVDKQLKDDGTTYIFCDARSYPFFFPAMFPYFKHVRTIIWNKIVSYNGYTWRHQHELIAWGERENTERIPTGDGDILDCRGVLQKDRCHPAEKPIDLINRLIVKHKSNNIVLDPFMGSGTTGVACVQTGRKFIGIEIEPKYFEIACKRIKDAQQQMRLPL